MIAESDPDSDFPERLLLKTAIKAKVRAHRFFRRRRRRKILVSSRYNDIFSVSGGTIARFSLPIRGGGAIASSTTESDHGDP